MIAPDRTLDWYLTSVGQGRNVEHNQETFSACCPFVVSSQTQNAAVSRLGTRRDCALFVLAIMSTRQPYAGLRRKLVVGIDVGTTFSGISFCILDPGVAPVIQGVNR
jgi:hypothetical protein